MPKPSRPLLHEWMHRFVQGYWTFRVWAKCTEPFDTSPQFEFKQQEKAIEDLAAQMERDGNSLTIEALVALPFVTAVERVNPSGNGRLVYVDWP